MHKPVLHGASLLQSIYSVCLWEAKHCLTPTGNFKRLVQFCVELVDCNTLDTDCLERWFGARSSICAVRITKRKQKQVVKSFSWTWSWDCFGKFFFPTSALAVTVNVDTPLEPPTGGSDHWIVEVRHNLASGDWSEYETVAVVAVGQPSVIISLEAGHLYELSFRGNLSGQRLTQTLSTWYVGSKRKHCCGVCLCFVAFYSEKAFSHSMNMKAWYCMPKTTLPLRPGCHVIRGRGGRKSTAILKTSMCGEEICATSK